MTEFMSDYEKELRRQWDAELRSQGKHAGPCQFSAESRIAALQENIHSLIAARLQQYPEEFDSGDDPISRLSRELRQTQVEAEKWNEYYRSPKFMEDIRREISYKNNVKKSLELQEKILGTLS